RQQRQRKMAKLQSVSWRFRKQMTSLENVLGTTEKHFVRCIKPNDLKEPPDQSWDPAMVNSQLKMLGALEMVRVRRQGYPIRSKFSDFLEKYPELLLKHEMSFERGGDPGEIRKACVA